MIPSDATGVISINLPSILKQGEMLSDDGFTIPSDLKKAISRNEDSPIADILSQLPKSGVDFETNIYAFFTNKSFQFCLIAALSSEEKAKQMIERATGKKFSTIEGVDFIRNEAYSYIIENDVLFIGQESKYTLADSRLAIAARSMIEKTTKSIRDVDEISECISDDQDISAFFDINGLKSMMNSVPSFSETIKKYPFLTIITDSDIKAICAKLKFEKEGANFKIEVKADNKSDFFTLVDATASAPDNTFLKVVPSSMQYLISLSINGENLMKLDQINKSVNLISNLPSMDKLDFRTIINSIDGPLAIGFSPTDWSGSESFSKDWNLAIAAKVKEPAKIINQIVSFANESGQEDMMKDGRHLYNYEGKPLYVGTEGNFVYAIRLDHELVEDSYFDAYPDLQGEFAKSSFGFFAIIGEQENQSILNFSFANKKEGNGIFAVMNPKANPVITFLSILCSETNMPTTNADSEALFN